MSFQRKVMASTGAFSKFSRLLLFGLKTQMHKILGRIRLTDDQWYWWRVNRALRTRGWWPPSASARAERWAMQLLEDIDGPLTTAELCWLYRRVRTLPKDAHIVELNPGAGQVTCCLALGCWATGRLVYSLWTQGAGDYSSEAGRLFVVWHQNIIRKHLVLYVTPLLAGRNNPMDLLATMAMLYVGHDPLYLVAQVDLKNLDLADRLREVLVVQPGNFSVLQLENSQTMGSLVYGYGDKIIGEGESS